MLNRLHLYNRSAYKTRFLIFIPIVLIVLIATYISFQLIQPKPSTTTQVSSRITTLLENELPEKAYTELKKEYIEKSLAEQHKATHLFGHHLYHKIGIDAFTICDPAFAFGCFHGVFTEAVKDNGLSIVSELDNICEQKFGSSRLGCQHGIGHGVLVQLGHEKLNEALIICETLSTPKAKIECDTGVFMEYNFPAKPNHSSTSMRLVSNDIYHPCSITPEQHKNSCYYILVQWWDQLFDDDSKNIGELCQTIKDTNHKNSCFLGIGDLLASKNDFIPDSIIEDCNLMPDENSAVLCRAGARGILDATVDLRHLSPDMCKNLDHYAKNTCIEKSNFFLVNK